MTDFPATANAFLENGIDQGTLRQRHQDTLLATRQLIGAAGIEDITIASGSITPTSGTVRVLYQGTAVDDLTTIVTTNLPIGSLLLLSIKDEGYAITVKHGTGAGNVSLAGGIDFVMNKLEQRLLIQRVGTLWYEIGRFGREKVHVVNAAGEPAFQNSWTALTRAPSFWKDENGVVHLYGSASKTSVAVATSIIFTLPAGYRPTGAAFPVLIYCAVGGALDPCWLVISTNGDVQWARATAPSTVTVLAALENISFRAEA